MHDQLAYAFVVLIAAGALFISATAYLRLRRLERYWQRRADALKPRAKTKITTPHMRRDLSGL